MPHTIAVELEPASVQLQEHGERGTSPESTEVCTTPSSFDQWDPLPEQSFITVPDGGIASVANIVPKADDAEWERNGLSDSYKSPDSCMDILEGLETHLQTHLQTHLDQLENTFDKITELEALLPSTSPDPKLPVDEIVTTLSDSILGIHRILQGNMSVMKQLRNMRNMYEVLNALPVEGSISSDMQPSGQSCDTCDELPELSTDSSSDSGTVSTELEGANTPAYKPTNPWSISSPGADPFVGAPKKIEDASSVVQLNFHPDFTELPGRKLYAPCPPGSETQGRRVVLNNLPPDATLAQVAKGVRCYGGIINISMPCITPLFGNTQTALLEFASPKLAAEYTDATKSHHHIYEAKNGGMYRAAAWLVPSPSYGFSYHACMLLEKGQTRVVLLKSFPKRGVWYFLCAIGLDNIMSAGYTTGNLVIELTNLFHAARVERLVWTGKFGDIYYRIPGTSTGCSIVKESSQMPLVDSKYRGDTVGYMAPYILEEEWNCKPFNEYWPAQYKEVMQYQGLSTQAPLPRRLSSMERLTQHGIEEEDVAGFLEDRQNHQDTDFRIVGSSITLTRRKWGWRISDEDETKLLMANTLHEPEWADQWDQHFKARGEVNLRRWEQYGMLAKHRREKAAEQGLEPWALPSCEGCEKGCRDLKSAPVLDVVKDYFDVSKFRVVDVMDEE